MIISTYMTGYQFDVYSRHPPWYTFPKPVLSIIFDYEIVTVLIAAFANNASWPAYQGNERDWKHV